MCSECAKERYAKTKQKREKQFNENDIRCIKHPNRKAIKYVYLLDGHRICNRCRHHRADGSLFPSAKKYKIKQRDQKRMQRAAQQPFKRKSIQEILRMRTGFKLL